MKKAICLFALLFVSLFASANTNEMSTSEFVSSTEIITTSIEDNASTTFTSFEMVDGLKVCYTTVLRLLVNSYGSPTTRQTMLVHEVYTSTICITV
jgi:hypothetical protein